MKVVSWNCNGRFRDKFALLDTTYHADLYIIQECENPLTCSNDKYRDWAKNIIWQGENKNRGLGIFSRDLTVTRLDYPNYYMDNYLPFQCRNYNFIGVWAKQNYIEDEVLYAMLNASKFNKKTIWMGDMNSSVNWNKEHGKRNHSLFNNFMGNVGLYSAYHGVTSEKQEQESQPTFFLYRHLDKPFHIDYCYCNPAIVVNISVGTPDIWLKNSDHMPLEIVLNV
ncbi:endonuclease/exonuclease/phosphatase family protein [uncultured Secundilactobacillus sp.]|uniref:endonuclease/exonuclease/phosphatase family protein n=1 Tax=uncultured Secundilactobacillus sp. TaxID=2813935 RepID=UPI002583DF43|nr:endonuclease/exonuclease/phosphatase family protein [uncultured Secundilactobacillus sp.]